MPGPLDLFSPVRPPIPGLRSDLQDVLERIRNPQGLAADTADVTGPPQAVEGAPLPPAPVVSPVGADRPASGPLQGLSQQLDERLGALAFQPQTQLPTDPYAEAIQRIFSGGAGGLGNPKADLAHAVNVRAEQLRYRRSPAGRGTSPANTGAAPSGGGDYASLPGKYGPLVDPPGGPSDLRLQRGAWQSLVSAGIPASAILPGSYRSHAQQEALYARDQDRYAPPGMSLHEYGLAIDVSSNWIARVRPALLAAGWYQERADEPWHFSYGFFTSPAGGGGGVNAPAQPRNAGAGPSAPRPPQRRRTRRPASNQQL